MSSPVPSEASMVFPCSACGKNLKVRPALAGKNVKCPYCGVIVPALPPKVQAKPAPLPVWRIVVPPLLLALILWGSFVLKLRNLDY